MSSYCCVPSSGTLRCHGIGQPLKVAASVREAMNQHQHCPWRAVVVDGPHAGVQREALPVDQQLDPSGAGLLQGRLGATPQALIG
jgi:hypothetical protein